MRHNLRRNCAGLAPYRCVWNEGWIESVITGCSICGFIFQRHGVAGSPPDAGQSSLIICTSVCPSFSPSHMLHFIFPFLFSHTHTHFILSSLSIVSLCLTSVSCKYHSPVLNQSQLSSRSTHTHTHTQTKAYKQFSTCPSSTSSSSHPSKSNQPSTSCVILGRAGIIIITTCLLTTNRNATSWNRTLHLLCVSPMWDLQALSE